MERDEGWLFWPYRGVTRFGQGLLLLAAALFVGSFVRQAWVKHRRYWGFLLLAALIGPILLVDVALKDYWGRARPATVTVFQGTQQFTPPLQPTQQCEKNCSFVSGHVATTAFIMALGWLGPYRRRWLWASAGLAAGIAVVRIIPGGHFLSDTLFAWYVIYASLWLTEAALARFGLLPRRGETRF